ncbi:U4/U6 small nuclear ribonucleoprotein Prp31 [Heterocephalus glaber]|uniref:U4/U6 small nuclear ribonucleoprotein Prp31 n=1 Tax=Heterocephalus glaber TaxID=10181 RepID=G5CBF5_HETGA|nr:U4/U6 small nuclear ribonucleoprotein Prp31 [Heterocephalus glaber]
MWPPNRGGSANSEPGGAENSSNPTAAMVLQAPRPPEGGYNVQQRHELQFPAGPRAQDRGYASRAAASSRFPISSFVSFVLVALRKIAASRPCFLFYAATSRLCCRRLYSGFDPPQSGRDDSPHLGMSLADELLADLEEAAEEEEGGSFGEEEEEPAIEDVQEETQLDLSGDSVKSIAKLWDSKMFAEIMMKIEEYISKQAKASEVMGPVEAAPEYRVIVDANNLTVEIENELNIIHKFIRDKYSKRFPELESLVPNALDYIRTVKELGNSLDKCKNNENLQQILTNATIMVVSVTASTTQGQQLSEEELERLEEACDMALELNASKHRIYEYVESRMSFIAPSLSIIVGASTAAKIMGVAGGLTNLSKMPACNIMLLGAQRKTLSGFSSTSVLPHTGYIYHSDIVQSLPPDLRRKAARLVAAKCTLAARVDSFHESSEGKGSGRPWARVPCCAHPHPRPHPVPPTTPSTHMQDRDTWCLLGLGARPGRCLPVRREMRPRQLLGAAQHPTSDTPARTLQKQSVVYGGKSTIRDRSSGTASSVAFTPLQGLEIVNPQAAEKKVAEANQKYFSSMAEFLKVKSEKSGITST